MIILFCFLAQTCRAVMSYECSFGDLLEQGFDTVSIKPKENYDPGEQLKVFCASNKDKAVLATCGKYGNWELPEGFSCDGTSKQSCSYSSLMYLGFEKQNQNYIKKEYESGESCDVQCKTNPEKTTHATCADGEWVFYPYVTCEDEEMMYCTYEDLNAKYGVVKEKPYDKYKVGQECKVFCPEDESKTSMAKCTAKGWTLDPMIKCEAMQQTCNALTLKKHGVRALKFQMMYKAGETFEVICAGNIGPFIPTLEPPTKTYKATCLDDGTFSFDPDLDCPVEEGSCYYRDLQDMYGVMKMEEMLKEEYKNGESCKVYCENDFDKQSKAYCKNGRWYLDPKISCESDKGQCAYEDLYEQFGLVKKDYSSVKKYYEDGESCAVHCKSNPETNTKATCVKGKWEINPDVVCDKEQYCYYKDLVMKFGVTKDNPQDKYKVGDECKVFCMNDDSKWSVAECTAKGWRLEPEIECDTKPPPKGCSVMNLYKHGVKATRFQMMYKFGEVFDVVCTGIRPTIGPTINPMVPTRPPSKTYKATCNSDGTFSFEPELECSEKPKEGCNYKSLWKYRMQPINEPDDYYNAGDELIAKCIEGYTSEPEEVVAVCAEKVTEKFGKKIKYFYWEIEDGVKCKPKETIEDGCSIKEVLEDNLRPLKHQKGQCPYKDLNENGLKTKKQTKRYYEHGDELEVYCIQDDSDGPETTTATCSDGEWMVDPMLDCPTDAAKPPRPSPKPKPRPPIKYKYLEDESLHVECAPGFVAKDKDGTLLPYNSTVAICRKIFVNYVWEYDPDIVCVPDDNLCSIGDLHEEGFMFKSREKMVKIGTQLEVKCRPGWKINGTVEVSLAECVSRFGKSVWATDPNHVCNPPVEKPCLTDDLTALNMQKMTKDMIMEYEEGDRVKVTCMKGFKSKLRYSVGTCSAYGWKFRPEMTCSKDEDKGPSDKCFTKQLPEGSILSPLARYKRCYDLNAKISIICDRANGYKPINDKSWMVYASCQMEEGDERANWEYAEGFGCVKVLTTKPPVTIEPKKFCTLDMLSEGMELVVKDNAPFEYQKKDSISLKCKDGYKTSLFGPRLVTKAKMKAYCKVQDGKYFWEVNGGAKCVRQDLCPMPTYNGDTAILKEVQDNFVKFVVLFRKNRVKDPTNWTGLMWCPFNIRGSIDNQVAGTVTTFMGSTQSISKNGDKATVVVRKGYKTGKHLVQIDTPDGRVGWTVPDEKKQSKACLIGMVDGIFPNLANCFEEHYSGKL